MMKYARLTSLGLPIEANTSNQTWAATVRDATGDQQVVLKALSFREFFNELVAWSIGSSINLPIPDVYLVAAKDEPALSNAIQLKPGERLCFASAREPFPSFKKTFGLTQQLSPAIQARLCAALVSWSSCGETIAFDTWLANVDRNGGNLLFATHGKHVLIDHGHCLTGPKWASTDLDPTKPHLNKLATSVAQWVQNKQDKAKIADSIIGLSFKAASVTLKSHVEQLKVQGWITDVEATAVHDFLQNRIGTLVSMARNQAGV